MFIRRRRLVEVGTYYQAHFEMTVNNHNILFCCLILDGRAHLLECRVWSLGKGNNSGIFKTEMFRAAQVENSRLPGVCRLHCNALLCEFPSGLRRFTHHLSVTASEANPARVPTHHRATGSPCFLFPKHGSDRQDTRWLISPQPGRRDYRQTTTRFGVWFLVRRLLS